jgi:hypothetical protein
MNLLWGMYELLWWKINGLRVGELGRRKGIPCMEFRLLNKFFVWHYCVLKIGDCILLNITWPGLFSFLWLSRKKLAHFGLIIPCLYAPNRITVIIYNIRMQYINTSFWYIFINVCPARSLTDGTLCFLGCPSVIFWGYCVMNTVFHRKEGHLV